MLNLYTLNLYTLNLYTLNLYTLNVITVTFTIHPFLIGTPLSSLAPPPGDQL